MHISHIAIWTKDLEAMKDFYTTYFGGESNEKYVNPLKHFESYFICFASGARLELMHNPLVKELPANDFQLGINHIAFRLGSEQAVRLLTERLRADGFGIPGEPRVTGDGYFESVVTDVEGNRVELVA